MQAISEAELKGVLRAVESVKDNSTGTRRVKYKVRLEYRTSLEDMLCI